jgi:ATP-binding cassette, subfamily B, bacterial
MTSSSITAEFTIEKKHKTDTRGPIRWIFSHLIRYWHIGIIMLLGALGNAALAAVVPVYIGQAYEAITISPPDTNKLVSIALLIAVTQLIRGILQFGRNFGAEAIAQRIERNIRNELYISLLGKSMTFHSLQPVGDTMARATNDVREVNFLFSPGLNLVIGSANFLLMPLLLAPSYHPSLILVPGLYTIGYAIALWQYLHELKPVTTNVRSSFGRLNTRLAEALDGIEIVKGTAQENGEVEKFRENARGYRDAFVRQGDIEARFIPLLLLVFAESAGLLHAILLYRQDLIGLGDVIAFFGLLTLFEFPTFVSLFAYSQISLGIAGARRIIELINKETELDQNIEGYIGPLEGKIEFKDVSVSYSGNEPAIENVSFRVSPGQTVAIVGQTGAGKTTLAKLINRTYDVMSGKVLIDNIDVRDWNLEALRQKISIIEQDIFLFSKTIAENISFGNPKATEEEIIRAAKAAQAHEFISSFKDGYQTVIGERGVTLSGGQRQRLALARAFLTDPRILILDDSTSSIDSETEDRIQRAIYAASKGRTTFIITHRLSQIRWADQIIVLRKGKIAAIGSHEELMHSSQAYRQIFTQ